MTGPLSLRLFFCLSLSIAVRNCYKVYAFYFSTNEISESNHSYISTTHHLAYTSGNGPSSATSSSVDSANIELNRKFTTNWSPFANWLSEPPFIWSTWTRQHFSIFIYNSLKETSNTTSFPQTRDLSHPCKI